jgi:(+)-pinoresinol hydroxylase
MKPPPGISNQVFARALRDFAGAVGPDWVFSSDEDVIQYDDSYTPFVGEPDKQYHASAAVSPASVEQVQQIVRISNKYRIPLYPISTGRNLGYGGSSPTYSGCVIVDLKRMDRVIEVNDREAYMVVEPGISFLDLQRYFDEHDHPFLPATPDPGWGSPIGNALDHGISGAAGDNFGMVHGLEVVLPTGELLRTGMGAVPTSKMWQNYRYGYGPYLDGIFSQSNFGIVTKMGFWLVRKPELQQIFTASSFKTDDMQSLLDAMQTMRDTGLIVGAGVGSPIRESMSTNDGRVPFGVPEVRTLLFRRNGGSTAEWDQLARDHNIPAVRASGVVRGPARVVRATLDYARDLVSAVPGVTFELGKSVTFEGVKNPMAPSVDFSIIARQETSHGHFYFSPMFKPTVEDIFGINDTIRNVMLDADDLDMLGNFGWSAGRGSSYTKAYMILMEFLIHDDVGLNRKRRELFLRLVDACGSRGWAEYRAPVAFQTAVMGQYTFNDHVLRRFNEQLKDAIDPNGILAPGKSGIWPRHLRQA